MISLLSLLLLSTNVASAETPVFVADLQPTNDDSVGMAALVTTYLTERLAQEADLRVIDVDGAPRVGEMTAAKYLASCPPGQSIGCAFLVGDAAEAEYAIAGTLESYGQAHKIDLVILDVGEAREAVSFTIDLGLGDEQQLAEDVAALLRSVIDGESGLEEDIRDLGGTATDTVEIDKDAVAAQLARLSEELGGAVIGGRDDRTLEETEYTMDDLASDMNTDGSKPWEQLGMSPGEYLRFKNSGLPLSSWKKLSAGRRFQLLIRPAVGVSRGAWSTVYDGRYALDPSSLEIVETYAYQARVGGTGIEAGGWIGFGLTPTVEVSVGGGMSTGRFSAAITQEIVGTPNLADEAESFGAINAWGGARAYWVPRPTSTVRPTAGAGVMLARGPGLDSYLIPPSHMPIFSGPWQAMAEVIGGVEASVTERVDFYALVPVSVLVAGQLTETYSAGVGGLADKVTPTDPSPIGAGLELGVTIRLMGKAATGGSYDGEGDL